MCSASCVSRITLSLKKVFLILFFLDWLFTDSLCRAILNDDSTGVDCCDPARTEIERCVYGCLGRSLYCIFHVIFSNYL